MVTRHRRAQRLPAADRRRAILDAVVPLLIERGANVTTAEMAEAAEVSEGTIFKVFPDKAALIYEAVKTVIDPAPARDALQRIDSSAPLHSQLIEAGQILLERLDRATALVEVLRSMPDSGKGRPGDARRFVVESNASITGALTELLEQHREDLSVEPDRVAAALRGLVFACGNPLLPPSDRLAIDEAVSILLQGVTPMEAPGR